MSNNQLTQAAEHLRNLKTTKKSLSDELTATNKAIQQMEVETLPKLMEAAEISKFTVDGVGTVYLSTEVFANVLAADRPKLYAWLREEGNGDMITDWVFPNTLTAFAKEKLNNGEPLPDFIKATLVPTANIRKA